MVAEYIGHRIRHGHWTYPVDVDPEGTGRSFMCYRRECGFARLRFPALT